MQARDKLMQSPAMDDEFFSCLRFVEPEDAEFICGLRSDPALNRHISASSPSVEDQRRWIEQYKVREEAGHEFYFVVNHQTRDYGVVRMYDFRGNSFSWGSWIMLPSRPKGLVTYSAVMVYEIGFDLLGFEQSHFDVRKGNQRVIDFHLRSGAVPVREDGQDQHFIFPRAAWPRFREMSEDQISAHRVFVG